RLSRELTHLLILQDELRKHGVKLEYVSHAPDDTPEGQLREQVLGVVAQYERAKIRERTARGRREKAREGKVPGGRTPLGYRRENGFVAIEEKDASIVRSSPWPTKAPPLARPPNAPTRRTGSLFALRGGARAVSRPS